MENLLEELYWSYKRDGHNCAKLEHRISCNSGNLKKTLTKQQKRLLLRIADDMGLITETESVNSFADGVRFGVNLMSEIAQLQSGH